MGCGNGLVGNRSVSCVMQGWERRLKCQALSNVYDCHVAKMCFQASPPLMCMLCDEMWRALEWGHVICVWQCTLCTYHRPSTYMYITPTVLVSSWPSHQRVPLPSRQRLYLGTENLCFIWSGYFLFGFLLFQKSCHLSWIPVDQCLVHCQKVPGMVNFLNPLHPIAAKYTLKISCQLHPIAAKCARTSFPLL